MDRLRVVACPGNDHIARKKNIMRFDNAGAVAWAGVIAGVLPWGCGRCGNRASSCPKATTIPLGLGHPGKL